MVGIKQHKNAGNIQYFCAHSTECIGLLNNSERKNIVFTKIKTASKGREKKKELKERVKTAFSKNISIVLWNIYKLSGNNWLDTYEDREIEYGKVSE